MRGSPGPALKYEPNTLLALSIRIGGTSEPCVTMTTPAAAAAAAATVATITATA